MILGITSLGHDASVAVVEGDQIIFAGHAERYSRVKNDGNINVQLLEDALRGERPERIIWYERPLVKSLRYAYAGQWSDIKNTQSVRQHLNAVGLDGIPLSYTGHHESHAAAGFFTSPFDEAAILVIDAIGEFDTISIWVGRNNKLTKLWSQKYPHSLGLLYSAFTQRIGFKPNEEEYIMMGMAAFGKPIHVDIIREDFIEPGHEFRLKKNVHRGINQWRPEITDIENIAASVQAITEQYLSELVRWIKQQTGMNNLVIMGGVALNCVANTEIAKLGIFEGIWIMPNPGDAGSSIGAIAGKIGRIDWKTPYLGHDIQRAFDSQSAIDALLEGEVIGIANGKAEFGPRSLGNRSIVTDPRGPSTKDRVNSIKKREPFRPFAPIVLEHMASEYFEMPVEKSPYMQFVAKVKKPEMYPAITHFDGTARVQTLSREQNSILYDLLASWYEVSGCGMLLNTSLNIKGEPLVNTWDDALRFQALYGVKIF